MRQPWSFCTGSSCRCSPLSTGRPASPKARVQMTEQGPPAKTGTKDDVLHRLARHAARAVPAEQAFVVLREPAAPGTMRVAAVAGADPDLAGRRFRVGEGLAGR